MHAPALAAPPRRAAAPRGRRYRAPRPAARIRSTYAFTSSTSPGRMSSSFLSSNSAVSFIIPALSLSGLFARFIRFPSLPSAPGTSSRELQELFLPASEHSSNTVCSDSA